GGPPASVGTLGSECLLGQFQQCPRDLLVEFGGLEHRPDLLQERHSRRVPLAGVTDRRSPRHESVLGNSLDHCRRLVPVSGVEQLVSAVGLLPSGPVTTMLLL